MNNTNTSVPPPIPEHTNMGKDFVYFPANSKRQFAEVLIGLFLLGLGVYAVYFSLFTPTDTPYLPMFVLGVGLLIAALTFLSVASVRGQYPIPWSVAADMRSFPFLVVGRFVQFLWKALARRR